MDQALEGKNGLQLRYAAALANSIKDGSEHRLKAFEAYAGTSHLTMNRSLAFALELADEKGVYSTFYQRRDAGLILPDGGEWDRLREAADSRFFGSKKEEIRFAALSTEGRGLTSYGECTFIPAERFVSHRTSFSEENTAHRLKTRGLPPGGQPLFQPNELADWNNRAQLSVSKSAHQVTPATPDADFPQLILKPGANTDQDEFVEGHIYGPMTIHSFRSISVPVSSSRFKKSVIKGLAEKLRKLSITTSA
ncbi:hypothetical protein [Prosthecobacter sp.]|uniref:hypothetical protein n=1 Tax=Prosthecobacter sp. TaxID=1965333 RepID=UPI0024880AE4|nr:hypothetical protein [Prosthecobacter sp.]MDI1314369.1 hypothetical protein [Prosthecobacter sp.]